MTGCGLSFYSVIAICHVALVRNLGRQTWTLNKTEIINEKIGVRKGGIILKVRMNDENYKNLVYQKCRRRFSIQCER